MAKNCRALDAIFDALELFPIEAVYANGIDALYQMSRSRTFNRVVTIEQGRVDLAHGLPPCCVGSGGQPKPDGLAFGTRASPSHAPLVPGFLTAKTFAP